MVSAITAAPDETANWRTAINAAPPSQDARAAARRRYETAGLVVMALVVLGSVLYALSWSSPGVTGDERGEPEALSLAPTQPSSAPAATLALGETFSGSRASTTVSKVRVVDAPKDLAPPAGEVWLGVRVERCASGATSSARAPWSRWVVVDDEGNRYRGSANVPDGVVPRPMTAADFGPGKCRTGSVVVAVPEASAETVASVRFEPPAGPAAAWQVDGR